MERVQTNPVNPLARLALAVPGLAARGASVAGRILGAALAAGIALQESYDPTQVFVLVAGTLITCTLAARPGARGDWAAAFGAGTAFFAGAVLNHLSPGVGMMAMGLIAFCGGAAWAYRSGRDVTLPCVAFLGAVFVTAALQVALVFLFE